MRTNVLRANNRTEFGQWLTLNGSKEAECWIRVKRGKPIDPDTFYYLDAVEEALCFGWIDSTHAMIDGVRTQRFTPRRKGSHWTELNKERVRRLEKLGLMINTGSLGSILKTVPAEALPQLETQLGALAETQPAVFLLGILERLLAVTFHLALTVLVWFAATRKGSFWLYPLSVLLHALLDAAAVIVSNHASNLAAEGVIAMITLLTVLLAGALWRKYSEQ